MKSWTKPVLEELSVEETLVGIVPSLAESEPTGFDDLNGDPILGNS